jgi:hypothetical protein
MTFSSTEKEQSISYPQQTIDRAERALCCSPFQIFLFIAMGDRGISLQSITGQKGIDQGYTQKFLTETITERELMWLINVGLLRREVDGQGLTDSFRLTPLGRQIVAKWENSRGSFPPPSWTDRVYNLLNRWLQWSL